MKLPSSRRFVGMNSVRSNDPIMRPRSSIAARVGRKILHFRTVKSASALPSPAAAENPVAQDYRPAGPGGVAKHQRNDGEIISLSSVRGMAAIWVVLFHFSGALFEILPESTLLAPLIVAGVFAVPQFFILSGYVLSIRYLVKLSAPTWRGVFRFWWLRLARVYPVHIFTLLVSLAMVSRRGWPTDQGHSLGSFIANCLLTHAWARDFHLSWNYPSWSISSEWAAYLLFPLIAIAISRATRIAVAVAVVLACVASILAYTVGQGAPFSGLLVVFPTFIGGVGLGRLFPPGTASSRSSRYAGLWLIPMFALPFLVVPGALQSGLYLLLSFVLVGVLGSAGNQCGGFLRSRLLSYLGEISYSLYMTHAITITLIARFLPLSRLEGQSLPIRCAAVIGCMMLIMGASVVVYYTIERPMRNWSRRVASH